MPGPFLALESVHKSGQTSSPKAGGRSAQFVIPAKAGIH